MSQSITLVIAPTMENVRLVGICTGALAASILDAGESARVELCVVEALNNVVEHAYGNVDGSSHEMTVRVDVEDSELSVAIIDHGTAAPVGLFDSRPELTFDPDNLDSLPEGGMGLFIIHDVMDDVRYTSEGGRNSLVMRKRLEAATS